MGKISEDFVATVVPSWAAKGATATIASGAASKPGTTMASVNLAEFRSQQHVLCGTDGAELGASEEGTAF